MKNCINNVNIDDYDGLFYRMYRDKLATLKDQLNQLENGIHPEYVRKMRRLEQIFEERVLLDEVFLAFEVRFSLRTIVLNILKIKIIERHYALKLCLHFNIILYLN